MKRIFSWSLAYGDQRRPRVIWLIALPLALSLLLTFTALASPALAATHTPTTSKLAATHIGAQTFRTDLYGDKIYTLPTATGSMKVVISKHASPSVIPASATGCVGNLPWNNVKTCFGIIGGGKYVDTMWVSAYVRSSPITVALVITGPGYAASTDAFYTVEPGGSFSYYVYPNRNMSVGKYCGQSELISGTGAGKACETVTA